MQVLYQIDATGETDAATLLDGLDNGPDPEPVRHEAIEMALTAWSAREQLDAEVGRVAAIGRPTANRRSTARSCVWPSTRW